MTAAISQQRRHPGNGPDSSEKSQLEAISIKRGMDWNSHIRVMVAVCCVAALLITMVNFGRRQGWVARDIVAQVDPFENAPYSIDNSIHNLFLRSADN